MNFNRRNFIRTAGILSALSLKEIDVLAAKRQMAASDKTVADDDESYWSNVRRLFPLTRELTYMNNGTYGPSPYPVIEATHEGMMMADQDGVYGNYDGTPPKLAQFVGANADEIALTHNVTEGINIACCGVPLKKGDEVILTTHEHVGNALPWMNRIKLHGIVIRKFTPAATAEETLSRIAALINRKTRVIACPHIPCTQGQVLPVKEICALARKHNLFSLIDGAHGPGMIPLDLHDMGCDTYAGCCHKWMLGPKGTGFLYIRKDFQNTLIPYHVGAGSDDGKWDIMTEPVTINEYAASAHRYYGGTQANGLYAGVNAAVDFLQGIGMDNIHRRVKSLGKYTQDSLLGFGDKIQLLTPTEERSRCAINGFIIKGVESKKFFDLCMQNKVRIRCVPENGLNSLRVSTHIYNNREDVDRLMEMIKKNI
ncbi:MAG: aminotransferase class V-fold PLP-dependent enzyme [Taibaiella sp.]|nr:aminotransferase class V-fold PLP-dependent enzyme [Taibaiella sp.]